MFEVYINQGKVAQARKLNKVRLWIVDNLKEGQTAYVQYVPSYWTEDKDDEGKVTKYKHKDTQAVKVVGVMKYDGRRDRYLWWPWNEKLRRQLARRYGEVMAPAYIVMSDGSVTLDEVTAHTYDKEHMEAKVRRFSGMSTSDFEKSSWGKVIRIEDDDRDWNEIMARKEIEKEAKIRQKRDERGKKRRSE